MKKENISNNIYKSFAEARRYVHTLKLCTYGEWIKNCKDGKIPKDIPFNPSLYYKKEWISLKDWLGISLPNENPKICRPYKEAEKFAHSLRLPSAAAWRNYCKTNKKPFDIPAGPDLVYKNKGWISWADWLGTNKIAFKDIQYRSFEDAKMFVHSLELKSIQEWRNYCKNSQKPDDIPAYPHRIYKLHWKNMIDWLGIEKRAPCRGKIRPFKDAKDFVRQLNLRNKREWEVYARSNKCPYDIPVTVDEMYKEWVSWGDWLGTGRIANEYKVFLPFKEGRKLARVLAKQLGLKKIAEYHKAHTKGLIPKTLPYSPRNTYKGKYISDADWLKPTKASKQKIHYKSYNEARAYVKYLNILSKAKWYEYSKSGKKPPDIPSTPHRSYKGKGWISWDHWLGYNRITGRPKIFKPFKEARLLARQISLSLNLKNMAQYHTARAHGLIPKNLPSNPRKVYNNQYTSDKDWLGRDNTGKISGPYRNYEEARAFVKGLNLKSARNWYIYSKSENRPRDIPSTPHKTYKDKGWISWQHWLGK